MNWLHYLLEANIYLAVFYLLYFILLDKETHYKLNRLYLLSACIISYVIPVVQVGILEPVDDGLRAVTYIRHTGFRPAAANASYFTLQNGLVWAYAIGAAAMFCVLSFKIFQLVKLTKARKDLLDDKYKLIRLEDSNTAFSFFNYVFIGTKVSGADVILRHELVHIKQKHSLDIVFLELIKVVSWFNPFIYLLQRSLKTLHEYIADEQTAAFENDALTYSSFLVSNAYGVSGSSITHSFFNYNLLKKRIIMLNQKRSGNLARLKYLAALPVCAGLLCASTLGFSKTYGLIDIAPQKVSDTTKVLKLKEVKLSPTSVKVKKEVDGQIKKNIAQQKKLMTKEVPKLALVEDIRIDPVEDTSKVVEIKKVPGVKITDVQLVAQNKNVTKVRITGKAFKGDRSGVKEVPTVLQLKKLPPPPPPEDPLDSFYKYVGKHVRYPVSARNGRISGKVIFEFDVVDGKINNLKIMRGLYPDLDSEALRVLKSYPDKMRASNGTYDIPITFEIWGKNNKMIAPSGAQKSKTGGDAAQNNNSSAGTVRMLNEVVVTTYL